MLSPKDLDLEPSLQAILVKLYLCWYTQHWPEVGRHWELLVFPFVEFGVIVEL